MRTEEGAREFHQGRFYGQVDGAGVWDEVVTGGLDDGGCRLGQG